MKTSIEHKKIGSLNIIELACGESKLGLSEFGAQAIYWRVNSRDIFFDNPQLILDKSKALRGGAPICFPWFNKGNNWDLGKELVPSHGSARNTDWEKISEEINSANCAVDFSFTAQSALNLPLGIKVSYSLGSTELKIEFKVSNLSSSVNSFELALHSYFATKAPESAAINGLSDFPDRSFSPQIPIDQIYKNRGDQLAVKLDQFSLAITNQNFSKSVVWHPGKEHTLSDLPAIHPVPFLCIESLTEITELSAKESWDGSVIYSISF